MSQDKDDDALVASYHVRPASVKQTQVTPNSFLLHFSERAQTVCKLPECSMNYLKRRNFEPAQNLLVVIPFSAEHSQNIVRMYSERSQNVVRTSLVWLDLKCVTSDMISSQSFLVPKFDKRTGRSRYWWHHSVMLLGYQTSLVHPQPVWLSTQYA